MEAKLCHINGVLKVVVRLIAVRIRNYAKKSAKRVRFDPICGLVFVCILWFFFGMF